MVCNYLEVDKCFKPCDIVYACAYDISQEKDGIRFKQEPIKGMLVTYKKGAGSSEESIKESNIKAAKEGKSIYYFVPFKKNSTDLAWSKAVTFRARYYASTESECIALYNRLIDDSIEWHMNEIKRLQADKIK